MAPRASTSVGLLSSAVSLSPPATRSHDSPPTLQRKNKQRVVDSDDDDDDVDDQEEQQATDYDSDAPPATKKQKSKTKAPTQKKGKGKGKQQDSSHDDEEEDSDDDAGPTQRKGALREAVSIYPATAAVSYNSRAELTRLSHPRRVPILVRLSPRAGA
jgi:hypothetical protein